MTFFLRGLLAAAFFLAVSPALHAGPITPEQARSHLGEEASVTGMVSEVGSDPRSGNVFINMGGRYPEHIFTGVIFGSNAARFPGVRSLEGKTITLEGRVRLHKQKPQIIIEERSQIILH